MKNFSIHILKSYIVFVIFFIFLFSITKFSFGQGSATGCYTQAFDNAVHTVSFVGTYANNTGKVSLSTNYCSWTPSVTGTTCRVCPGSVVNATGACRVSATNTNPLATVSGFLGTFNMVLCPLDDYIPYFILVTGGLGFFYLRRKNTIAVG
jgi:hypothetical protein